MLTLKTGIGSSLNADIVCVIDTSSSMRGEKITQVKDTIRYLLKILKP